MSVNPEPPVATKDTASLVELEDAATNVMDELMAWSIETDDGLPTIQHNVMRYGSSEALALKRLENALAAEALVRAAADERRADLCALVGAAEEVLRLSLTRTLNPRRSVLETMDGLEAAVKRTRVYTESVLCPHEEQVERLATEVTRLRAALEDIAAFGEDEATSNHALKAPRRHDSPRRARSKGEPR